jgi:hypothetical protein
MSKRYRVVHYSTEKKGLVKGEWIDERIVADLACGLFNNIHGKGTHWIEEEPSHD